MPTKNKTTETQVSVTDFLDSYVENEQKKQDSLHLIKLMKKWTGHEPRMWGPTIIGFGRYHYKYASGHEGEMPLLGFSPRKAEFSLYVTDPTKDYGGLLDQLGKYKMGKSCIYFKKLSDLNLEILETISRESIQYLHEKYTIL